MPKMRYLILALTLLFFVLGSVRFLPAKAQTGDWTTYEDYDPLVMAGYSAGEWQSVADGNALGGQLTQTSTANATLTLYFQVTEPSGGYSIIYSKTPDGGNFQVQLDQTTYGPFSSYSASPVYGQEVSHENLPAGVYSLTLTNLNGTFRVEAIRIQGIIIQPHLAEPETPPTEPMVLAQTSNLVEFRQDFADTTYGPTEAHPIVTGSPVARIGFVSEISPWITLNITRRAMAYATNTSPGTTIKLEVELTLGDIPDAVYTVSAISFDYFAAILYYPPTPPVHNQDIWVELKGLDGSVLYTSPTCHMIDLGNCKHVPFPQGPVANVHSIHLHNRAIAAYNYLAYFVTFDEIIIQTPPTCQVVATLPTPPNEAVDMKAVMGAGQLLTHAGPTFNAKRTGGFNPSRLFTSDFRYEVYDEDNQLRQVWFSSTGTESWILGWMKDETGNEYEYVVDHANCQAPALTEFTFLYDRQAATEFGMAQANMNDTSNPRPIGERRVSHPLPAFPYPNLNYRGGGLTEGTDSALFTSEVIWVGGIPMTTTGSNSECHGTAFINNSGWRYCTKADMDEIYGSSIGGWASRNWRQHQGLLVYYTGTSQVSNESGDIEDIPRISNNDDKSNTILSESHGTHLRTVGLAEHLSSFFITSPSGEIELIDDIGLDDWVELNLSSLKAGDYVFINPDPDEHGFIVAGWGPIELDADTCATPISIKYTTLPSIRVDMTVPYVVDFSNLNGDPLQRTQTPVARPFYCSKYAGTDTFFGSARKHSWYFFQLPDEVQIAIDELYIMIERD